jgi:tight adherence protein B
VNAAAWALAACLLTVTAVVAAWPARTVLRRLPRRPPKSRPDLAGLLVRVRHRAESRPRRALGAAALSAALAGLLVAGPVAAAVAGGYAALGMRAALGRAARRRAAAARSRDLDDLTALAADLRAGLPAGDVGLGSPPASTAVAVGSSGHSPSGGRLRELTAAVWRLAERTGAPVADLVERIEADARADDRARAAAAAEAAGMRATAVLLAALPVGGIGLGYSVGVDPLQVLLHTPLGAACAVGALVLQSAGLLWADRLIYRPTR